jgi:hypothetical protein
MTGAAGRSRARRVSGRIGHPQAEILRDSGRQASCFSEVREPLDVGAEAHRDHRRGANVALGFAHQAGAMPIDCSRSRLPAANRPTYFGNYFETVFSVGWLRIQRRKVRSRCAFESRHQLGPNGFMTCAFFMSARRRGLTATPADHFVVIPDHFQKHHFPACTGPQNALTVLSHTLIGSAV